MDKRPMLAGRIAWMVLVMAAALTGALAVLSGASAMSDQAMATKIGLVTDSPIIMDGGFNQMSYEGLVRAQTDLEVVGTVYTSTDFADIQTNLEQCATDGNMLCIMVGFAGRDPISNTAQANPGTNFAILDATFDQYPSNLQGMEFASQEAAYLAGTLAGKMTESNVLGLIGGMPIPTVDSFLNGYSQGALCSNPEVSTIISYTNNFVDPELGAQFAQSMMSQGADVIFPPAGPTGVGAILTATQSGAWAVGFDVDQYMTVFQGGAVDGADHLLTSAMKRLDNAVFSVISETVSGGFTPGTVVYDLAKDGVGLAPYHEADASIPSDAKAAVEAARSGIIAGTIDPYAPCADGYKIYLPLNGYNVQP